MRSIIIVCLVLNVYVANVVECIEPITIGVVALAGCASYYFYGGNKAETKTQIETQTQEVFETKTQKILKVLDKFSYCNYMECCTPGHIPYDIDGLKADFNDNLFGQHIANLTLIRALKSHMNNLEKSQKPLVMSFHGTPGTGKNFVADLIVKRFYVAGEESGYVYRYRGRIDFPLETQVALYRIRLKDEIQAAVKKCRQSIFIFDEVDKMPPGVFESIASLLDHHSHVDGIDFRQSIFIFLTNTGGVEIVNALQHMMEDGKYREQTTMSDFERIAEAAAFNINGGLKSTTIITSSLIDHFVPFLPLERRHVEKCVDAEFRKLNRTATADEISDIVENHVSYNGIFSRMGCKRLDKKVAVVAEEW